MISLNLFEFPNTLINRIIIQKTMTNHQPLAIKDLVCGKVEPYPWWPGKIMQIISEENTLIYKVSFFGDSSYSFLKKQQLIKFSQFDFDLNSSFPQNLKLQKAVKQANRLAFDKKMNNKSTESQSTTPDLNQKPLEQIPNEMLAVRVQGDGDQNQQVFQCQETNHEIEVYDISSTEVTAENIFVLIQSLSKPAHGNSYSYSKRKRTISFKQKLKQALLLKYHLFNCFQENPLQKPSNCHAILKENAKADKRFKREGSLKIKQNFILHKDKIKYLLIRKIKKCLFRSMSFEDAKQTSKVIYEIIEQKRVDSNQSFIKFVKKLLRELNSNVYQNSEEVMELITKIIEER